MPDLFTLLNIILLIFSLPTISEAATALPLVINTWPFTEATLAAYHALTNPDTKTPTIDAIEAGCSTCEELQCDGTVGYGGSPDDTGETTLDAMIMDGTTFNVGAVANLRHVKEAATVARLVMERTKHSLLTGLQASQFAMEMGMSISNLSTNHSAHLHRKWVKRHCPENFRMNVEPDPRENCGPYHLPEGEERVELKTASNKVQQVQQEALFPAKKHRSAAANDRKKQSSSWPSRHSHDTIAMVAIDAAGNIAAGASSNGAIHKIAGRVGDAAITGGGAYADSDIGGCGSTGDGDLHIRFLPCYQVIESMRLGASPQSAAEDAIRRIAHKFPEYKGAVIAVNKHGEVGASCFGWTFYYSLLHAGIDDVQVVEVQPIEVHRR